MCREVEKFPAAGRPGARGVTLDPNPPAYRTPNPVEPQVPPDDANPSGPEAAGSDAGYTGAELWRRRIGVLVFVFTCAVFGVFLVILPWGPIWSDNHLLLRYPGLRAVVDNGFARGVCGGLGVLDIWIGFWEAVHYHEEKAVLSKSS